MKHYYLIGLCLLSLIFLATHATAGVPNQISYQGRLTDSEGAPVPDGDYNLTFQIVEHDPVPMGESPLWSSGAQSVSVTDGLFVYYLGSSVPLPASIFTDDGLESHYLRFALEGSPVYSTGVKLAAVPFAFRAASSDTAAYAHSGPGSGATGWVDDGSVVRLQSGGDRVGIGTTSPSENLVVGGDLGSFPEANYIVSGNLDFEGYSGFKLGYNADNHATINWYGDGDQLSFHTQFMGTSYNNTMVLREGKIGINNSYPGEPLSIGPDLGAYYGDFVQIGRLGSGRYSGFMCGEDENNRGTMMWINNTSELRFGGKYGGVDYGATMTLKEGNVGIGTTDPAGLLHVVGPALDASVQLPTASISNVEIANEAGFAGSRFESIRQIHSDPGDIYVIDSVILDAPGPGIAIVHVNSNVVLDLRAALTYTNLWMGISKTTTFDDKFHLGGDYGNADVSQCASLSEYYVVSAGPTTFYLLAQRDDASLGLTYVGRTIMTVVYSPTWYGAGKSADYVSKTEKVDLNSQLIPKSGAIHGVQWQSQSAEVDALRTEFDAKLKTMEEEFQRKLEEMQNER